MKTFSIGDTATKRFVSILKTPIIPDDTDEFTHVAGEWPGEFYYFDGEKAVERGLISAVIDKTEVKVGEMVTITGLPPVTVSVDGEKVLVDDGVLTVRFQSPGEYSITIDEPEWLCTRWKVSVDD